MAVELPYFQFFVNDWMGGLISRQPRALQGFFIDLCSIYWKQGCKGDIARLKAYIPDFEEHINLCFELGIVEKKNKKIVIKFLKKQFTELSKKSTTNSRNGRKGGRRKGLEESEIKANAKREKSERLASSEAESESELESELEAESESDRASSAEEFMPCSTTQFLQKVEAVTGMVPSTDQADVLRLIQHLNDEEVFLAAVKAKRAKYPKAMPLTLVKWAHEENWRDVEGHNGELTVEDIEAAARGEVDAF